MEIDKNNSFIDILKIFFSICVVGIHSNIWRFGNISGYIIMDKLIFRLAVPFFFVCSGYFIGNKIFNSKKEEADIIINKQIKRLLYPFIVWSIIGLPHVINLYKNQKLIIMIVKRLIFHPWNALWYVLALIVSLFFIKYFYKKNKLKLLFIISIFLYMFNLLCNSYYFIANGTFVGKIVDFYVKWFMSARNGVFVGIFFVLGGMLLSKYCLNNKLNKKKNIILFIIFYILYILEVFLVKDFIHLDDSGYYIMSLPLIIELFIVSSFIKVNFNTIKLRNYSSGIYFSHTTIINIISMFIISYFGESILSNYITFIISLIIIIFVLTILYKLNNKYINRVIK